MPKTHQSQPEQAPLAAAPTEPTIAASDIVNQTPAQSPTPEASPPAADVPAVDLHLDAMAEAEREATKRGFMDKVMQARANQQPKPYTPPERAAGVIAQTNAEMKAGAEAVAKRAAEEALRAPPKKEKWDGDTATVFRPSDYSEYKNIKGPNISKEVGVRQPRQPV